MDNIIGEVALNRLGINNRRFNMKDHVLFICSLNKALSFNMIVNCDGRVKIWRFINTDLPKEYIGEHLKYSNPEYPGIIVGFEVTEDCDLSCYVEQYIDISSKNADLKIENMLYGFLNFINDIK